jgi:hypothetical protein
MMGVIRFVVEPNEQLRPWAVLRTPLFGAGYDLLHGLAHGVELTLEGLKKHEPLLHRSLHELIDASRFASPSEFLRWVFANLPVFESYPGKEEVLLAMYESAYRFEQEREPATLAGFVRHLQDRDNLLKTGASRGVNVQTIHGAKGLEFHTVIVPFLSTEFNGRLDRNALLFSRADNGAIETLALPLKKYREFSVDHELGAMTERHRRECMVDEVNALYVALTRARENLILLPSVKKNRRTVGNEVVEAISSCFGVEKLPWFTGAPVAGDRVLESRGRRFLRLSRVERAEEAGGGGIAVPESEGGSGSPRRNRLIGLVVHRSLERLRLPVRKEHLDRHLESLVDRALAREGGGFTASERTGVKEHAVSTLRQMCEDPRL